MSLADVLTTAYLTDDGLLGGSRHTWLFGGSSVISAALVVATFVVWPKPEAGVIALAFVMLVACAATDLASFRIPNLLTYSGSALVLITVAAPGGASFSAAALGALLGFAIIGGLSAFSRGKVGLGDVKLSAFGGALVGVNFVVRRCSSVRSRPLCSASHCWGRKDRPFAAAALRPVPVVWLHRHRPGRRDQLRALGEDEDERRSQRGPGLGSRQSGLLQMDYEYVRRIELAEIYRRKDATRLTGSNDRA